MGGLWWEASVGGGALMGGLWWEASDRRPVIGGL